MISPVFAKSRKCWPQTDFHTDQLKSGLMKFQSTVKISPPEVWTAWSVPVPFRGHRSWSSAPKSHCCLSLMHDAVSALLGCDLPPIIKSLSWTSHSSSANVIVLSPCSGSNPAVPGRGPPSACSALHKRWWPAGLHSNGGLWAGQKEHQKLALSWTLAANAAVKNTTEVTEVTKMTEVPALLCYMRS